MCWTDRQTVPCESKCWKYSFQEILIPRLIVFCVLMSGYWLEVFITNTLKENCFQRVTEVKDKAFIEGEEAIITTLLYLTKSDLTHTTRHVCRHKITSWRQDLMTSLCTHNTVCFKMLQIFSYERPYFKKDFCKQAPLKFKIDTSRCRMMIIFEIQLL